MLFANILNSQSLKIQEDFSSSKSSFPEFRNEKGYAKIDNGKYIVHGFDIDKNQSFNLYCERRADFTKDYSIKIGFDYINNIGRFFWAEGDSTCHLVFKTDKVYFYKYIGGWQLIASEPYPQNFSLKKPLEVEIIQKNGNLNILCKQKDLTVQLFNGKSSHNFGESEFGFMGPNYERSSAVIEFFEMEYYPFEPAYINIVENNNYDLDRVNLGELINSEVSETNPRISSDGNMIYFTRKLDYDQMLYSEIIGSEVKYPKLFEYPINREKSHSVLISVSGDDNAIYLNGKYKSDNKYYGEGISYSSRTEDGWSNFNPIEAPLENLPEGDKVSYFLSSDKKYLISSLNNNNCIGSDDLFVSFLQDDGSYSEPLNLGSSINTKQSEMTPFMSLDNETLYFASDGQPGFGKHDIFVTRRLDDTWQKWSEPKNLGSIVNSSEWEAYYVLDGKGDYAYVVSYQNSYGGSDIFRVEVAESAKPKPIALVTGKVLDSETNLPISADINFKAISDNTITGKANSNPNDGKYKITLPYGNNYEFFAVKDGYLPISENLDLEDLDSYIKVEKDIYLTPIKVGQSYRLNNIFFDTGKFDLLPNSYPELDRLISFMKNNNYVIEISGHTDNVGSLESNMTLSDNRANSVLQYLTEKGISADRLEAKGYGETVPIKDNKSEEGRAYNRRVEFKIIK